MSDELSPSAPPVVARRLPLRALLLAMLLAFATGAAGAVLAFQFGHVPDFFPFLNKPTPPAPTPATPPRPLATAATPPPSGDLAGLIAREEDLATRLKALENRTTLVDASSRTAAGYADRAEALMVLLAARRTLSRGEPLRYLEDQLRARFGDRRPQSVAAVIAAGSGSGHVTTLEDLQAALDVLAPKLMRGNAEEGWWQTLRHQIDDMIVLRRGDSPSPRPADRLKRARHALEIGQIDAAVAEVERMPGVDNASSWLAAARRFALGQRGLADLEESILTQPAPPPGPPPPPASTPVPAPAASPAPAPPMQPAAATGHKLRPGSSLTSKAPHHV